MTDNFKDDPYGDPPFESVETTCVIEKVEFGKVIDFPDYWKNGSQPVNITVSYTNGTGYPHSTRADAGFFHPTRMQRGADNSDLTPNQQQTINIARSRIATLAHGIGMTVPELLENPELAEGRIIGVKLVPHYKYPDKASVDKFFVPKGT